MHGCTEEDYALFYEPASQSTAIQIEEIKKSGGFMCVDWKGVELAPLEDFGSNRKVMLVDFLPCNT